MSRPSDAHYKIKAKDEYGRRCVMLEINARPGDHRS